jgi:hypothetical protein
MRRWGHACCGPLDPLGTARTSKRSCREGARYRYHRRWSTSYRSSCRLSVPFVQLGLEPIQFGERSIEIVQIEHHSAVRLHRVTREVLDTEELAH